MPNLKYIHMENRKLLETFLTEKGAYLGTIASLATADHTATRR
jgi:hypothetical protein